MIAPTQRDFTEILEREFKDAEARGLPFVDIRAGDLHKKVGGYPGPHNRMPICSDVMCYYKLDQDEVLHQPEKGWGASLQIRYKLPRPQGNQPPKGRYPAKPDLSLGQEDGSGIERRLQTHFGDYWRLFDDGIKKLLINSEIVKQTNYNLDSIVWVAPLAKALERILHAIVAPHLPKSTAAWPDAPRNQTGVIPPAVWSLAGFSKFFDWATSTQTGKSVFEQDLGSSFRGMDQLRLASLNRLRNLAIHDSEQQITLEQADGFYREVMGSAAKGRSLIVEIYDMFTDVRIRRPS